MDVYADTLAAILRQDKWPINPYKQLLANLKQEAAMRGATQRHAYSAMQFPLPPWCCGPGPASEDTSRPAHVSTDPVAGAKHRVPISATHALKKHGLVSIILRESAAVTRTATAATAADDGEETRQHQEPATSTTRRELTIVGLDHIVRRVSPTGVLEVGTIHGLAVVDGWLAHV